MRRSKEPLDLAFHELKSIAGVAALAKSAGADDGDESKDEAKGSRKRNVNAVRINNNELPTLEGLAGALEAHLRDVTKVQWIDVSFNQLSTVPAEELKSFPKLSRLYLHANAITSLAEVEKLQSLGDTLRSLTLHGNPVAEKPLYRNFVISTLPWLRTLDFSPVTDRERDRAITWRQMTVIKRKKRPKPEDAEAGSA